MSTSIALKRQGEAFSIAERYRGQSLLTLLSDEAPPIPSEIPPELEAQRKEIATRYDAIYREIDRLSSVPKPDKEAIRNLIQEQGRRRRKRDVIDAKIRRAARGDAWQPPESLPLEEIRQALDPGTLLVSYVMAEEGLDIFLFCKLGDLEVRHVDVEGIKLWLGVRNFYQQVHDDQPSEARNRAAGWLYERLLQPIADRIEASDRLLILPDGPLHYLPFAALTRPAGEGRWQYLVEWKPLHLAASATVYAELRKRRPAHDSSDTRAWELVAFGDPDYPGEDNLPTAVRSAKDRGLFDGLTRLPNTNREIREISRLFPPEAVRTHLRGDAREERAKAEAGKARIVHFATHGFADPEVPLDSFLALTIPAPGEKADDNGILQAWEILQRHLDADLVVLSACETGFGPERGGEGLMSLSRAFQIVGARTVAASLWRVNDLTTSELMIRFYRHLRDGKSKDEALQAAQLELIHGPIETVNEDGNPVERDLTSPYHWAAFQIIGDWQ
ncbi:MAG: CHAT domain-containing protein [bacterium]|nr:CHAT domain-containing protein [bacterium]